MTSGPKQPKRYSLKGRKSKVKIGDLASPHKRGSRMADFLNSLPRQLAAVELKDAADSIVRAHRAGKQVIAGFGGHVVKVGLGPVLIDLIRRGVVTALATNGSGVIHDFELAYAGKTSEDVDSTLGEGTFGFAAETGRVLNECIGNAASEDGPSIGETIGEWLRRNKAGNASKSICVAAYDNKAPLTVHAALGTDIVHMHPEADGAKWGEATMRDFRKFCETVAGMEGGVYINMGSAVILPEVFLKAVTRARNRGKKLKKITTIDIDFIRQYRPQTNVVRRPASEGGRGISITGHHELVVPLLAAAIIEKLG